LHLLCGLTVTDAFVGGAKKIEKLKNENIKNCSRVGCNNICLRFFTRIHFIIQLDAAYKFTPNERI
jgi:hypothetical protein